MRLGVIADFRRVLDSSVVYRGRNGRWEPPPGLAKTVEHSPGSWIPVQM
jgi:hypothetical protein